MQPLKRSGVLGTEVGASEGSHPPIEEQNRQWWCVRWGFFRSVPCASDKCRGVSTIPVPERDPLWCHCEG